MKILSFTKEATARTTLAVAVLLALFVFLVLGVSTVLADGGAISQPRSGALYWYNPASTAITLTRTYRAAGGFTAVNPESVGAHQSGSFLTGNVSKLEPTSWPNPPAPLFYQGAMQVSTLQPLAMAHMETVTPRWGSLARAREGRRACPGCAAIPMWGVSRVRTRGGSRSPRGCRP